MFFGYEALSAAGLPVYCSSRMAEFLRRNSPWNQLVQRENIKLHSWDAGQSVSLTQNVSVRPILVPHRDEYSDTFGLWIQGPEKKLLYIPDIQNWAAWDRSLPEEAAKADVALLDGTFFSPRELPGRDLSTIGHPFIRESMQLLEPLSETARTRVFFTHLNHSNPAADASSASHREIIQRGFAVLAEGREFYL
jgi:pyrroloquinoline quinone biosynthesis protein B